MNGLGLYGSILGLCWPILREIWAYLRAMLAHLGAMLAHLGPILGLGWPILGLCCLGHKSRKMGTAWNSKKHRKTPDILMKRRPPAWTRPAPGPAGPWPDFSSNGLLSSSRLEDPHPRCQREHHVESHFPRPYRREAGVVRRFSRQCLGGFPLAASHCCFGPALADDVHFLRRDVVQHLPFHSRRLAGGFHHLRRGRSAT